MLIAVITAVDILTSPHVHLAPFLVAAPAVTASFEGPRMTAVVGGLAVVAESMVALIRTTFADLNHTFEIVALVVISAIVTLFAQLRVRREGQMSRLRSVAEAAQRVVLRPLPGRSGPLRIASMYLAADAEAKIGGDLYAAARTGWGSRLIIGDVRGKGLEAVGDAAVVLGAFRAAAHLQAELPVLVAHLEGSVVADLADPAAQRTDGELAGETFVTAAVLDVPDRESVLRVINCGHPPPLLLRNGGVVPLDVRQPAPPLGLAEFMDGDLVVETFSFVTGDVVLLYTDGVIECRDTSGTFYPLADRVVRWCGEAPEVLLTLLCEDLLAHAGGALGDDAAIVAIERVL
ncbi:PP2C family protein-serine/threonine phosphatase [Streptomyces sp. NPDC058001]|uniref:PP2C family protein-serine/threonine phosphatase n=1 Tax=Streptomyces sp. NPDC058001 TaxID=3346300 RepID=UPI0036E10BFC